MSLPAIAKQLEAKGRHGDTRLVHVTESELKGLHALAEAHGKKITINPETGLPEAFSLKSLLPTLLGAGLAMTGIGAPMAALMVGGGYSVATGSLQKGLMAGLGAYGGAGLTGGLMGAGTAAGAAGANAGANAAVNAGTNVATNAGNVAAMPMNQIAGMQGGANAAFTGGSAGIQNGLTANQANLLGYGPVPTVSNAASSVSQAAANTQAPTFMQTAAGNFDKAAAGAKNLYAGGWDATSNFLGANKMNLGLAAAPMVSDALSPKPAGPQTPVDKGMIRPHTFAANQTGTYADGSTPVYDRTAPVYDTVAGLGDTSEKQHFNPVFTAQEPYAAARGGIVGLAPGGVVENEAAIKAVGMNTDFPMAHIQTPIYANPMMSRPDAREVVNPSGDVGVDEFTGEPRMASGGIAGYGFGGTVTGSSDASNANGVHALGGDIRRADFTAAPTKEYSYNPTSQEFTETTTTPAPVQQQRMGPFGFGVPFGGMGGAAMFGSPYRLVPEAQQPPAPSVVSKISGGIMDPYVSQPEEAMANGGAVRMASGGPSYSYDPATQQFTQLRAPSPYSPLTAGSGGGGFGAMIAALVDQFNARKGVSAAQRGQKVSGGVETPQASTVPITPRVTGGIIPAEPVAQAPQSIYDTPVNQRLGLTNFYPTMDYSLDKFGSQFQPPPPSPEETVEQKAAGGMAGGGYNLGGYSDGGRLLKGPGDGVSDSIPASIGGRQPARLADGEFVVPARIVSELGNGSTEAGARKLYAMMDRVQKQRRKTVGKGKVAVNSRADKHLPA
jgi:hypothetical protein